MVALGLFAGGDGDVAPALLPALLCHLYTAVALFYAVENDHKRQPEDGLSVLQVAFWLMGCWWMTVRVASAAAACHAFEDFFAFDLVQDGGQYMACDQAEENPCQSAVPLVAQGGHPFDAFGSAGQRQGAEP